MVNIRDSKETVAVQLGAVHGGLIHALVSLAKWRAPLAVLKAACFNKSRPKKSQSFALSVQLSWTKRTPLQIVPPFWGEAFIRSFAMPAILPFLGDQRCHGYAISSAGSC